MSTGLIEAEPSEMPAYRLEARVRWRARPS